MEQFKPTFPLLLLRSVQFIVYKILIQINSNHFNRGKKRGSRGLLIILTTDDANLGLIKNTIKRFTERFGLDFSKSGFT